MSKHSQEAEALLQQAKEIRDPEGDNEYDQLIAAAQVHAILAVFEELR